MNKSWNLNTNATLNRVKQTKEQILLHSQPLKMLNKKNPILGEQSTILDLGSLNNLEQLGECPIFSKITPPYCWVPVFFFKNHSTLLHILFNLPTVDPKSLNIFFRFCLVTQALLHCRLSRCCCCEAKNVLPAQLWYLYFMN